MALDKQLYQDHLQWGESFQRERMQEKQKNKYPLHVFKNNVIKANELWVQDYKYEKEAQSS